MISFLVVNYRSAAMTADAVRSARESSRQPLHVVIVDNSCDADEPARLRAHADVLLVSATNRGYEGAINDGRRECIGEIVVVANPDVVFLAGAIDRLVEALQHPRRAVAGPTLYWDVRQQWILPPADERILTARLDEAAAARFRWWRARRDRRRIRQRVAFWSLEDVTPVRAISGAVMAIGLDAFDAVGGFDERFPLYFEETDFLRRILQHGHEIVYVPSARCRHIYNQSAGAERERAAELYGASERAYWTKWYGERVNAVVRSLYREAAQKPYAPCAEPMQLPHEGLLVEASPLPTFETAAGHWADSTTVEIPAEVWSAYRDPMLYLRAVDPVSAEPVTACVRYRS